MYTENNRHAQDDDRGTRADGARLDRASRPGQHARATQTKGHGRAIAGLLFDDDYRKTELYARGEYDVTVPITCSFRDVSVKNLMNSAGFDYADLGALSAVVHGSNFVLRTREGVRCPGRKRRDVLAQVGIRAAPKLPFLANSYDAISDGRGHGVFAPRRYHDLCLSGTCHVSERVPAHLGASGTVAGRNRLRERGRFAGLCHHF